jgi:putative hydrolase of the HAD superfamily
VKLLLGGKRDSELKSKVGTESGLCSIIRNNSQALKVDETFIEPQLKFLLGIKAVLFDVYGTLFISGSGDIGVNASLAQTDHLDAALAASGIHTDISSAQLISGFTVAIQDSHQNSKDNGVEFPEVDIVDIWRTVFASASSSNAISDSQLETLAVEYETRVNAVWPMPKLETCLEQIGFRKKLGIISNAQFFTLELFPAFLNKSRKELGFDDQLEFFSFEFGHAKPGMTLYDAAVERLAKIKINPAEVLYVGNDMLNDIMPAQHVGFKTALFAGDKRSLRWRANDLRVDEIEPEIIVTDLSQIPHCIGL